MPVLTRLIPSPVVVDINAGALDDLAGLLADQRISASGKLAIAISGGSGARLRERLSPRCRAPSGTRSAAAPWTTRSSSPTP